ncbi:hypothetical protein GYMLUDRAFT_877194 [Collybiopsis luxurians FD-317 M1]|nr:hypothetical protein GYMLUDRAFT_877194 [Collybiopsis luxurians FD-317 M1]
MLLLELPSDLLLRTLEFVKPRDLFAARKTCRQLRALTLERTVWIGVYRKSGLCLPPGLSPTQTVRDLERVLLRAELWAAIWAQSSSLEKPLDSLFRTTHTMTCSNWLSFTLGATLLEIYRSRYLIIGDHFGFFMYDLDTSCPILLRGEDHYRYFWFYQQMRTAEHNADFLLPFGVLDLNDLPNSDYVEYNCFDPVKLYRDRD